MKTRVAVWLLLLPVCGIGGKTNEAILSEVSVLTIHVSDTNTHEGVFQFLQDVLKLPVDYGPEMIGERRYAAVYAGNLFIEPCGPYSNMRYPVKDFRALFFGLNCRSPQSPSSIAAQLDRSKIAYEKEGPGVVRVQDGLIADGIYLAVDSQTKEKTAEEQEALLASAMSAKQREGPGIEYVKEIQLGYVGPGSLKIWREFLGTPDRINDTSWRLNRNETIRLVRSKVQGVRGIVLKVRSLEKAEAYLKERSCVGRVVDGRIELDKGQTFGLSIYFSAE